MEASSKLINTEKKKVFNTRRTIVISSKITKLIISNKPEYPFSVILTSYSLFFSPFYHVLSPDRLNLNIIGNIPW